jgi:hypothetical protein
MSTHAAQMRRTNELADPLRVEGDPDPNLSRRLGLNKRVPALLHDVP